jgi:hypothetical protein
MLHNAILFTCAFIIGLIMFVVLKERDESLREYLEYYSIKCLVVIEIVYGCCSIVNWILYLVY